MFIKKQFLILAVYFLLPLALHAQEIIDISINGISEGVRTTRRADRDEAILDAKLQAVQRAGVNIQAETEIENFMLKRDWIISTAEAYLLPGYSIIDIGYGDDDSYHIVLVGKIRVAGIEEIKTDTPPPAPVVQPLPEPRPDTFTDIDGNVYRTITIRNQVWMAENLRVTRFANGDPIPNASDAGEWRRLDSAAYCAYDNDLTNASIFGYLYNWHVMEDSRNIASEGWRIPTDSDWKVLEMNLGMLRAEADKIGRRGSDEGGKLKAATHWASPNTGATNSSGFSALPAGFRDNRGTFRDLNVNTFFWTAPEIDSDRAWYRNIHHRRPELFRNYGFKRSGYSIRLVKDN